MTKRTREAVQKDDHAEIKAALDALNQLWHQASEKLYQSARQGAAEGGGPQGQPGGEGGNAGPEGGGQGPVDAEFEVVDEKKK